MPSAGRALTASETALAAAVFGPALDPAPVRLSSARLHPFQPRRVVMAVGQTVWFGRPVPADLATSPVTARALLLHELTHLAQEQAGMDVWVRGVGAHVRAFLTRTDPYAYALGPAPLLGRPFEHQAAMVEDAYRMISGVPPRRAGARLSDLLAALGHPARASFTASFSFGAPPLLNTPLR